MSHANVWVALSLGTGRQTKKVIEEALAEQMKPFDEDEEVFADGSRWDWYVIGGRYEGALLGADIKQRRDLNADALRSFVSASLRERWVAAQAMDNDLKEFTGFNRYASEDEYIAAEGNPSAYAFLRALHWHENGRLGWFGTQTLNECQVARGEDYKGKCLHVCKRTGARIVGWNVDDWDALFWKRFIEPLPPETWIVNVDFHV